MNGYRSVLIVDESEETQEVLQTVLQRRGVRTLVATKARQGLELAQRHHPDLIVLDLEMEGAPAEQFSRISRLPPSEEANPPLDHDSRPHLVLLGSLRRQSGCLERGEFVSKPYHYGRLIRRIEELLEQHEGEAEESASCRRSSSSAEPIRAAALN